MSIDDLKKIPFDHDGEAYEVWIALDRPNSEFRIAVRKEAKALVYRLTDTGWMRLSYHVSFETEQDAVALQTGSALQHMIEVAKSDLKNYDFRVLNGVSNG